jgi:TonB family protein
MAILNISDQLSHDLTSDLKGTSRYLKIAITLSLGAHLLLLILGPSSRKFYQAIPQGQTVATTIQVSLHQEKLKQKETHSKPKLAKRKTISKPKESEALKPTKQSKLQATSAPKTFDFYIQDYVEPIYPRIAQRRGITGKVVLMLKVGRDGRVEQVSISQSSGHSMLDESAVSAAKKWRFKPLAPNMAQIALNKKIVFTM